MASPKRCRSNVRDQETGLDPTQCDGDVLEGLCTNRKNHVTKYRTGFCIDEHCEGTEHKSSTGRYYPTCKFWLTCPCECHETISEMYKMIGQPRRQPVSKYVPEKNTVVIPNREEVFREFALSEDESYLKVYEHDEVPDLIKKSSIDLPERTSARGRLEYEVHDAVASWIEGGKNDMATTAYISKEIGSRRDDGVAPSRGAIDSVLKRWAEVGYAVVAHSPTRFAGFTRDGKEKGLAFLRAEHKRKRDIKNERKPYATRGN